MSRVSIFLPSFVILISLGLSQLSEAAIVFGVGKVAPDFVAVDSNGKNVRLSDYSGKIIIMEWTSPECPYSNKKYSSNIIQDIQSQHMDSEVVWLTITSSAKDQPGYLTGDQANKLLKKRGARPTSFLMDHNGVIGGLYRAKVTPYIVVINKDSTVAYAGSVDSGLSPNWSKKEPRQYLKETLLSLKKGNKPDVSMTYAYGCMIKYVNY